MSSSKRHTSCATHLCESTSTRRLGPDALRTPQTYKWSDEFTRPRPKLEQLFLQSVLDNAPHGLRGLDINEFNKYYDSLMIKAKRMGSAKLDTRRRLRDELLYCSLLRKFTQLNVTQDEAPSIAKWCDTERSVSNNELWWKTPEIRDQSTHILLARIRIILRNVLGKAPSYSQVAHSASHGPGVAVGVPYRDRDSYFKYRYIVQGQWTVYNKEHVYPYLYGLIWDHRQVRRWIVKRFGRQGHTTKLPKEKLFNDYLRFLGDGCKEVSYNILFTVPKTTDSRRPACKEALVNMMLQRGLGSIIRQRFKRAVGIDLDYQHDIHRQLIERSASLISTIDLSAASDSISWAFVQEIFSDDWVDHFERLRAPATKLPDGTIVPLAKISSMGNGFTFELESVVFYAIAAAAQWGCSQVNYLPVGNCSVYGDDIIIPNGEFSNVVNALTMCGFSVNQEKTHTVPSILRESCGWFKIEDLPTFELLHIKECNSIRDLFIVHNRIVLSPDFPGREILLSRFRQILRSFVCQLSPVPLEGFLADTTHYDLGSVLYDLETTHPDTDGWMVVSKPNCTVYVPLDLNAYMHSLRGLRRFRLNKGERFRVQRRLA